MTSSFSLALVPGRAQALFAHSSGLIAQLASTRSKRRWRAAKILGGKVALNSSESNTLPSLSLRFQIMKFYDTHG
jgi:hypothetical protein